jgi:hypothetical protein
MNQCLKLGLKTPGQVKFSATFLHLVLKVKPFQINSVSFLITYGKYALEREKSPKFIHGLSSSLVAMRPAPRETHHDTTETKVIHLLTAIPRYPVRMFRLQARKARPISQGFCGGILTLSSKSHVGFNIFLIITFKEDL